MGRWAKKLFQMLLPRSNVLDERITAQARRYEPSFFKLQYSRQITGHRWTAPSKSRTAIRLQPFAENQPEVHPTPTHFQPYICTFESASTISVNLHKLDSFPSCGIKSHHVSSMTYARCCQCKYVRLVLDKELYWDRDYSAI